MRLWCILICLLATARANAAVGNVPAASSGQSGNAVLSNLVGTVAGNVTNVVSLSTTNATSKPLTNAYSSGVLTLFGLEAGANITLGQNASNITITGASGTGFAAVEIMSNNVATAGGVRAGLATNVVFKFPEWSMFQTNNSGSNSVEITVQPYRPFAVLDNTNVFYESPDWQQLFNEQFIGDNVASYANNANKGGQYWSIANAGVVPTAPIANPFEVAIAGAYSLSVTSSDSGQSLIAGASTSGQIACTNLEIFLLCRFKTWRTNIAGNIATTRFGLVAGSATVSDPTDGIFVRTSTNANNGLDLVTRRASSATTNWFQSAAIQENSWTNAGFWIDRTGTNVVMFMGNSPTNLVSVATNVANIPNSVLVTPWLNHYLLVAGAGNAGHTNWFDYMQIMIRRL